MVKELERRWRGYNPKVKYVLGGDFLFFHDCDSDSDDSYHRGVGRTILRKLRAFCTFLTSNEMGTDVRNGWMKRDQIGLHGKLANTMDLCTRARARARRKRGDELIQKCTSTSANEHNEFGRSKLLTGRFNSASASSSRCRHDMHSKSNSSQCQSSLVIAFLFYFYGKIWPYSGCEQTNK